MGIGSLISPLFAAAGLFKKKPKPPPAPTPVAQERPNSAAADALAARRGSRDNQRSGRGGAEVPATGKSKLGQ